MTGVEQGQLKAEIRELTTLCNQVAGQNDPRSLWLHELISSNIALRRTRLEAARADFATPALHRHRDVGAPAGLSAPLSDWWAKVKTTISEFS